MRASIVIPEMIVVSGSGLKPLQHKGFRVNYYLTIKTTRKFFSSFSSIFYISIYFFLLFYGSLGSFIKKITRKRSNSNVFDDYSNRL